MLPNVSEELCHLEDHQKTWTQQDKNHFLSHVWNRRRAAVLLVRRGADEGAFRCRWEAVTGEAELSDPQTVGSRRHKQETCPSSYGDSAEWLESDSDRSGHALQRPQVQRVMFDQEEGELLYTQKKVFKDWSNVKLSCGFVHQKASNMKETLEEEVLLCVTREVSVGIEVVTKTPMMGGPRGHHERMYEVHVHEVLGQAAWCPHRGNGITWALDSTMS